MRQVQIRGRKDGSAFRLIDRDAMPRYFFHTLNDEVTPDCDGEILAGPAEARREATKLLGEIVRDCQSGFLEARDFSVLCLDDEGDVVIALTAHRRSPGEADTLVAQLARSEAGIIPFARNSRPGRSR